MNALDAEIAILRRELARQQRHAERVAARKGHGVALENIHTERLAYRLEQLVGFRNYLSGVLSAIPLSVDALP